MEQWFKEGVVLRGRYSISRPLGQGGMATTYLARDHVFDRQVALKLLRAPSMELLDAFRREFSLLARTRHPNLVGVYEFGTTRIEAEQVFYYAAEYVDGLDLATFARDQPWSTVEKPLIGVLEALAWLHSAGIRHGDVKPDNVLVTDERRGVLIDLGCAHVVSDPELVGLSGTPAFTAPEVLEGRTLSGHGAARADLFSFGAMLEVVIETLASPPPRSVALLTARLVEPDPRRRPADVCEVLEAFGVERSTPLSSAVPHLLGRRRELERFEAILDALWEGRSKERVVWIHGPSGVGTTRVLQEMAWRAQLRGGAVVEGVTTEVEPVLSMLLRASGGGLEQQRGSRAESEQRDASMAGLGGVLEERDRIRERREPTVLIVDDVHRMPEGELELFEGLLRSIDADDPVLIVCTSKAPSKMEIRPRLFWVAEIEPLIESEIASWVAPYISVSSVPDVMRLSGGFPAIVETVLSEIAAGTLREDRLDDFARRRMAGGGLPGQLSDLERGERYALALIALGEGFIDAASASRSDLADATFAALHHQGWIVPDGGGWKLRRAADAKELFDRLDDSLLQQGRRQVIASIGREIESLGSSETARRSELTARLVEALSEAGEVIEAENLLSSCEHGGLALRSWCRAVDVLASRRGANRTIALAQAAIHCEAGNPDEGLRALALFLADRPQEPWTASFRLQAARCYLRLGDVRRCLRQVRRALTEVDDADTRRERLIDVMARALIQLGEYGDAGDRAREAIPKTHDPSVQAALYEDVGVAESYLGEVDAARTNLRRAEELLQHLGAPRDQVRLLSYEALNEYRVGKTGAAARAYEQALGFAERHGLSDQIASTALNLGTACHQQGDWGRALECYERGLRTAVALGTESTTVILKCNLAQLYRDVGAFDRSHAALVDVEGILGPDDVSPLAGLAASLRSSLDAQAGRIESARDHATRARSIFGGHGARREIAEVDVQRAELESDAGDIVAARVALASAESIATALGADDVWAHIARAKGQLSLVDGDAELALREILRARDMARQAEQRALEAEAEAALGEAYRRREIPFLAQRHSERARELWERIAATLPPRLHDMFWSHPLRRRARLIEAAEPAKPTSEGALPDRVTRLLEIYRQLGSSLKISEVLRRTLDAAIELTGAERGFLVLRKEDARSDEELEVVLARNLDREQIGRSHLKLSRSIAEQVIATGEAVLTVDALADDRFKGNASVHAMRLRSVVCVPIRASAGVLGALYLDNRFERGRFKTDDGALLLAFADQAAIALNNARLVEALERRTAELDEERRRVEALAERQAEKIDRLSEDLKSRQRTLEHRYDYSQIVGRGPAMSQVLATLDQVIETTLPVLIEGESGTGKELCARAIHFNGPRRDGPFVTVNCAALTETLLESELFGHVKGAFTGAMRDRTGLFVEARGGTLFLDEIGEMPLGMQAKLLRVLQEHEVKPVGSDVVIPIDVRLVAATNRHLQDEVAAGRFREDLYYRTVVVEVRLPPLRERVEDIPALVQHLLSELTAELSREPTTVTTAALRKLVRAPWPGNVRQLKNVLSRAVVLAEGDVVAGDIELPAEQKARGRPKSRREYESKESNRILGALESHGWNVSAVARTLGMARSSLYRKMERYGLLKDASDT